MIGLTLDPSRLSNNGYLYGTAGLADRSSTNHHPMAPTHSIELFCCVYRLERRRRAGYAAFLAAGLVADCFLGDKSNHVASLHLPQLLYFFPFAIFFSWPVILPHISALVSNPRSRRPRTAMLLGFTAIAVVLVYLNTVVHPFTLSDNRHYPFYVFRYFILPPYRKYLLASIYIGCGWLCIAALGPASTAATARISTATDKTAADGTRTVTFARVDTVHVSFVLVFLVTTALSLVTAPLVEPRYFLIPWLIWRLHVPELLESDTAKKETPKSASDKSKPSSTPGFLSRLLEVLAHSAPSIELLWYMAVNALTGYLFIYRPFAWAQEPDKLQRFMW